jgi:hypothetical protein
VRFQTGLLASNFQFLDLALLKTRLLESVYYCHMHPPLFNLFVGLLVKLFPAHYGLAQHVVYALGGALASVLLYGVMIKLLVAPKLAAVLTIVFVTAPGCVFYEDFPMYEYPIMVLLLVASALLYRLLEQPGAGRAFWFFLALALLCLLRSIFHLGYFVLIAIALAVWLPKARRAVLIGCLAPLILVLALYAKNWVVFGMFSSSSWLGINMASCTTHQLTPQEKESLVKSGEVSSIALIEPPSAVADYAPYVGAVPHTGIPVLDEAVKSTGGGNFNNLTYLRVDPLYRRAAMQVLRHRPVAYLRSVLIAWFCYFLPPTDYFQFGPNREAIPGLERLYNRVLYGQFRETSRKGLRALLAEGHALSLPLYTGTFLMVLLPLILVGTLVCLIRDCRKRTATLAQTGLTAFLWFNTVWIMGVSNFLASFENNRYRFPTDPLYVALLAMLIQRTWVAWGARQR